MRSGSKLIVISLALIAPVIFIFTAPKHKPINPQDVFPTVVPNTDSETVSTSQPQVKSAQTTNPTTPIPNSYVVPSQSDYTPPSYTYNPSPVTTVTPPTSNVATPDPSKCAGINEQRLNEEAALIAQDKDLQTQIANYQNYLKYNTNIDTSIEQTALQNATNQLKANVSQISNIDVTYGKQLAANMCK